MTAERKRNISNFLTGFVFAMRPAVFMCLWNWFVTELGFPRINYWLALGLMLTIEFVQAAKYHDEKVDIDYQFNSRIFATARLFLALIFGFLAHLFV